MPEVDPNEAKKLLRATKHCRHYDYDREKGPLCAKGVNLELSPVACCMPLPSEETSCLLREEYTEAERKAWRDYMMARGQDSLMVLAEVPGRFSKREDHLFWGKSGNFDCPACKRGKVHWRRDRSNGHIALACTTEGCVQLIQ